MTWKLINADEISDKGSPLWIDVDDVNVRVWDGNKFTTLAIFFTYNEEGKEDYIAIVPFNEFIDFFGLINDIVGTDILKRFGDNGMTTIINKLNDGLPIIDLYQLSNRLQSEVSYSLMARQLLNGIRRNQNHIRSFYTQSLKKKDLDRIEENSMIFLPNTFNGELVSNGHFFEGGTHYVEQRVLQPNLIHLPGDDDKTRCGKSTKPMIHRSYASEVCAKCCSDFGYNWRYKSKLVHDRMM